MKREAGDVKREAGDVKRPQGKKTDREWLWIVWIIRVNHKDLDAWKQSLVLVEEIYKLTRSFPKEEIYGLTSQIRRAAVSVPSNISEGAARSSKKEFINFLNYSLGSLAEIETQLIIAKSLQYIDSEKTLEHVNRVRALVIGLRNHVRNNF